MSIGIDSLKYYKEFPEKVFAVNENGDFINKMDSAKTPLNNTQYWENQNKKIGLVMLLSGVILISILLFETKLIEVIWSTVLNLIGGLL